MLGRVVFPHWTWFVSTLEDSKMIMVAPLKWSELENIDDIEPIGDGDVECLVEIRDVLKRHGKMERLGVALLHSHFEVAGDEIMLESVDEESRTLTSRAIKETASGDNKVATILMLRDGDAAEMTWCREYCKRWAFGHAKTHDRVKDVAA
jgi:hypothetical protein